jgi:hypothetical protein
MKAITASPFWVRHKESDRREAGRDHVAEESECSIGRHS